MVPCWRRQRTFWVESPPTPKLAAWSGAISLAQMGLLAQPVQARLLHHLEATGVQHFEKFHPGRLRGKLHRLQHPTVEGRTQVPVQGLAVPPPFQVTHRRVFPGFDHEMTAQAVSVRGEQGAHRIEHVDEFAGIARSGLYGDEG